MSDKDTQNTQKEIPDEELKKENPDEKQPKS